MNRSFVSLAVACSLVLSACGEGSGTATTGGGGSSGGGTTTAGCSLVERQNWAFAQLNEWYLFSDTLPASLSPTPYTTVDDYIDALTATARAQRRDRFFTYITSIAKENAFNNAGSSAGIGIRLSTDAAAKKAFITEAFEGAPGLNAGLDRGDEIIAIGDTPTVLRTVTDIITAEGTAGVTTALGATTAGVTRTLRVTSAANVTRNVTVTKADYALSPVSSRYGAQIIVDNGKRVGYLNLRTFISTADPQLRTAFDQFRAAGITEFIVDFRYNGGGLVSTAELMGDLLGGNRATSEIFSQTTYRTSKSSSNSIKRFARASQAVSPVKIAFIGTGATASASELVINGFVPYLGVNVGLIGANTFGKPVGQVALDKAACDDRLRAIAFSLRNAANSDAYYDGLASAVQASCAAGDDVKYQLGDSREASVRQALDFLAGKTCTPIAVGQTAQAVQASKPQLLRPMIPTVEQREVPGLF